MSDDRERFRGFSSRRIWYFRILALLFSLLLMALVDLGLHLANLLPPPDPVLLHAGTYREGFSPFVESEAGVLTIKPEWISQKDVLRARRGKLAGRYFLYPGFRPCRITRNKAPRVIRIFALGGSTTFGLHAGQEQAFPAVLQRQLSEALPDRPLEVFNLGCPGLDSTRTRILVDTVVKLDPDLLIVYSGHNELVRGDTGTCPPATGTIHSVLLSVSAIYGWMNHGLRFLQMSREQEIAADEAASLLVGDIPLYEPLHLPAEQRRLPTRHFLERTVSDYAANIRAMISRAREARVPILFVLPVSNLLYPPKASVHEAGFAREEAFDSLLKSGWSAFLENRPAEALRLADKAIGLSPVYAMAWYLRGRANLNLGRQKEGVSDLQKAGDLDVRMHRVTSRLQQAMIGAVEASGARWIDPRPDFYRELNPTYAKTVFVDHCHPTRIGHRMIAERLLPEAARLPLREDSPASNTH